MLKPIDDFPQQSIVYISPKILLPTDVAETSDFVNNFYQEAKTGNTIYNELYKYYENQGLYLAKDYQTKQMMGFLCANDNYIGEDDSYAFDNIFIRNTRNKLRILSPYNKEKKLFFPSKRQ